MEGTNENIGSVGPYRQGRPAKSSSALTRSVGESLLSEFRNQRTSPVLVRFLGPHHIAPTSLSDSLRSPICMSMCIICKYLEENSAGRSVGNLSASLQAEPLPHLLSLGQKICRRSPLIRVGLPKLGLRSRW